VSEGSSDVLETISADQVQGRIANGGEKLRSRLFANAAGILSHRDVPYPMQAVLDLPMVSGQRQEELRIGPRAVQGRDPVNRFGRFGFPDAARALQAKHLAHIRPIQIIFERCRAGQRADFQSAMPFIDGRGRLAGCLPLLLNVGGKSSRRNRELKRCHAEVWAGCL
jgi:hypothetical protein